MSESNNCETQETLTSPLMSTLKRKLTSSMPDLRNVKKVKKEKAFIKLRRSSGSEFNSLIEYEIEKLFDDAFLNVDGSTAKASNHLLLNGSGDDEDEDVHSFLERLKGLTLTAK